MNTMFVVHDGITFSSYIFRLVLLSITIYDIYFLNLDSSKNTMPRADHLANLSLLFVVTLTVFFAYFRFIEAHLEPRLPPRGG